jgi:glutamate--cysteine ligase
MRGELPVLMGEYPTLDDWIDHVSTAFPEVRLKSFIEMRGADSVPLERVADLADFWDKMIYNPDMLDKILAITQKWDINLMKKMRNDVPKQGFLTHTPDGQTLRAFYDDLLKII